MEMLSFDADIERPFIVQVFGHAPEHFLTAAKVIEQMGADGIDINMGCPAAKVVSSCHGAALIRNPQLAAELLHAAVKAVSIPVSVKTRLGWDTHETLIPFCQALEQAGAQAGAIHGRRYNDKFSGKANWYPIYELKKNVSVPVIGNGDIASAADVVAKIGNLDGVMVGRGTFGNPWVMGGGGGCVVLGGLGVRRVGAPRHGSERNDRPGGSGPGEGSHKTNPGHNLARSASQK